MSEQRNTPNHIAFIMDGNRRWAKKLSNIVAFGHSSGGENVEKVLTLALDAGIPYTSMWALSKENIIERDPSETATISKLQKAGIRMEIIGDLWLVPPTVRTILLYAIEATKAWDKMTFILAIAYSGQDEIVRAVKRIIAEGVDPQTLTEREFLTYLDSGKYPPPDLIVRTGGSIRHSGFYLYQSAYSEYYFTDTLWPDFGPIDFQKALDAYALSGRNFGK
jgi:undecaprenyl diphosphate synthase